MNKKSNIIILGVILLAVFGAAGWFVVGNNIAVLAPEGTIADQQRSLLVFTTLLMLIVVVPVFIMTFMFAWKYREGNTKARYEPNWDHNTTLETIWWGVPLAIISVLAVITWYSSHSLDPYRALQSDAKPVTVRVVALQWKWLFIYPEHDIATVNHVVIPEDTPINFELTADAPMNSFWVPQLGGQVYAMSGMTTKLHLTAEDAGVYNGVSANISGLGFSQMKFSAEAKTGADFDTWVQKVRSLNNPLTATAYTKLSEPTVVPKPLYYSSQDSSLYATIIMKYMMPPKELQTPHESSKDLHHKQEEAHEHHH